MKIHARQSWTDPEPDTFTMAVKSSTPDGERFLVVSGNSTWLSLEQAREVREALNEFIELMKAGPDA